MLPGRGRLLLVGAGKMGGAMLDRWLASGLDPSRVAVLDPFLSDVRAAELMGQGVETHRTPPADRFDLVVLAVKPQAMEKTLPDIAPLAAPDALIVSVAAGVRIETLAAAFGDGRVIVRVMPNTPAQIGKGMSVAVAAGQIDAARRSAVEALLDAVGDSAWVEDEALIDAVTAVSGSGPAYVFLLAECLAQAGEAAGLPPDLAGRLARQTVIGGGALIEASPESAAKLRENVTSPNGTTAAALAVLMAPDGLGPLLEKAVEAARKRSVELG